MFQLTKQPPLPGLSTRLRFKLVRHGAVFEARRQLRALRASADSPWRRLPAPGTLRGIDAYPPSQLLWVAAYGMYRHKRKFGFYPDIATPRGFNDKILWLKLFGEIHAPLAGDKLATHQFIPHHLRGEVGRADVVWHSDTPTLPDNAAVAPGAYYLKANHGSGMFRRVAYPITQEEKADLEHTAQRWLGTPYGRLGGEWWYTSFPSRIFLERSVSSEAETISWNFYVLNGEVPMIGLFLKHMDREPSSTWLGPDFRPLPQQPERPAIPHYRVPSYAPRLLYCAQEIGKAFSAVRVDFLQGDDERPYLCELTYAPGDGLSRRPAEIDQLLSKSWKVLT